MNADTYRTERSPETGVEYVYRNDEPNPFGWIGSPDGNGLLFAAIPGGDVAQYFATHADAMRALTA